MADDVLGTSLDERGGRRTIGAIAALMNSVHQPRTLVVLGLNAGMGTAAGADELRAPTRVGSVARGGTEVQSRARSLAVAAVGAL